MIRGIKFVGVPVTDQDKALKFWTESIGMIVATDQPFNEKQRWIELKIPGADTVGSAAIAQGQWRPGHGLESASAIEK